MTENISFSQNCRIIIHFQEDTLAKSLQANFSEVFS